MNSRDKIIAIFFVMLLAIACTTFFIIKVFFSDPNNNVVSSTPNNGQPLQIGTPNQLSSSTCQSTKETSSKGEITSTGTGTTETEITSPAGLLAKELVDKIEKARLDAEASGGEVKGGLSWLFGNMKDAILNFLNVFNVFSKMGNGSLEKETVEALKKLENETKDVKVIIPPPGETTLPPGETTLPPGETTLPPGETTPPTGDTTPPTGETTPPTGDTTPPTGETTPPTGETTLSPGETTLPPGETTLPPGETTPPTGDTTPPTGETTLPPGETTPPTGDTTPPTGGVPVTVPPTGTEKDKLVNIFEDLDILKSNTAKVVEVDLKKGRVDSVKTKFGALTKKVTDVLGYLLSYANPLAYMSPKDQNKSKEAIKKATEKIEKAMSKDINEAIDSGSINVADLKEETKDEGEAAVEVKNVIESSEITNPIA